MDFRIKYMKLRLRRIDMSEFLLKAKVWDGMKRIGDDWLISEKLDGMRCFWDGGITRGMKAKDVMWANTVKNGGDHVSTGLWSDGGKVIFAPDWWVEKLPPVMLDGELWTGRKDFQNLCSIARSYSAGRRWEAVKYMVFESPTRSGITALRQVEMSRGCKVFIFPRGVDQIWHMNLVTAAGSNFEGTYANLVDLKRDPRYAEGYWHVLTQMRKGEIADWDRHCALIVGQGAEGLIARSPRSIWTPERRGDTFKIKPYVDDEGIVMGVEPGKGRLEGMMGSVTVGWKDKEFQLSGFTDAERQMDWSALVGQAITFKYRELTDAGVPKEARYYRPDPRSLEEKEDDKAIIKKLNYLAERMY